MSDEIIEILDKILISFAPWRIPKDKIPKLEAIFWRFSEQKSVKTIQINVKNKENINFLVVVNEEVNAFKRKYLLKTKQISLIFSKFI